MVSYLTYRLDDCFKFMLGVKEEASLDAGYLIIKNGSRTVYMQRQFVVFKLFFVCFDYFLLPE